MDGGCFHVGAALAISPLTARPAGNPLVLSTYPGQSYVPGLSTFGKHGPQLRPVGPPHIQNIIHTQTPLNWRAPGAFCGGVEHPAPFLTAPSALRTTVPASDSGGIQNYGIHWHLGLHPPAPRPFAQMAPIMFPMNARQWPGTVYGEGTLPTFPAAVPLDDSSRPPSVYENFRRWQRFKTLVRRQLPQTPDVEALSCFLIPVLRSLSRREPTMTMEEGLRKGLQEWQRTSNFDRMVFYETAEKFMEFEAAEEMEDPRMQLSGVFQCRPPPATPRLEIRRPPVPEAVQQPAAKTKAPETKVPETKARKSKARRNKVAKTKGPENKAPEEIPPEAIQEYMDIMDELFGPTNFATWEPSYLSTEELAANLGEEELEQQDDLYPDPSLMSYVDENFVNKPLKTANSCSVDEDLQSLDFLLISQHRLLPWELSQSQAPPIETLCSVDQAIQAPPPQRGLLSSHPPPGAMAMKSALTGRTCFMKNTPCTGPPLQVTGGQDVDLELAKTSQPLKRKCTSSGNLKKKRP
ncbi:NUT family member 2D-like [Callospermophilus lateralis]|uniref:NUT family member 2D-like n=1 Tax=Callospermophilus lateralis TaxID=76772 RepID=UPI004053872E